MRNMVVCCAVLAVPGVQAARAQIVADESFEISGPLVPGPGPWQQSSTYFYTPLCNGGCSLGISFARTGDWWAWFGGNNGFGPEIGVLSQQVLLPPGPATLAFYLKAEADSTDRTDFLRVTIDGIQVFRLDDADAAPYRAAYARVEVDISRFGGGGRLLRFDSHTVGDQLTNFYVDDVSILADACYANCDGSTEPPLLNIQDFLCFQNRYAAGDPEANCDGSTGAPVLNLNDYMCYMSAFAAGCGPG